MHRYRVELHDNAHVQSVEYINATCIEAAISKAKVSHRNAHGWHVEKGDSPSNLREFTMIKAAETVPNTLAGHGVPISVLRSTYN